jgi:hypothetical protein
MKQNTVTNNGSSSHLTIHTQPNPEQKLEQGKAAAKALMTVANPVTINGKAYLRYEDLQTIAAFFQCTAGTSDPEYVEIDGIKGYKAQASVRNKDGVIISTASAYCLREGNWIDRENFSLASMAQTRSAAKALRNAFGWVITLSGCFEPTPAEEMPINNDFSDDSEEYQEESHQVEESASEAQIYTLGNLIENAYLSNEERLNLSKTLEHSLTKSQAKELLNTFLGRSELIDGKWEKVSPGIIDQRKEQLPD